MAIDTIARGLITNLYKYQNAGLTTTGTLQLGIGPKTATAVAGAATLNKSSGKITTEALTTAAGASYTLTVTNSQIAAADSVFASLDNGTNISGLPIIGRVTPASGSVVIAVNNCHPSAALNGTLVVSFFCIKSGTLQLLSLSANAFPSGAVQGAMIGTIQNTTPGSAITISAQSNAGAVQVAGLGNNVWQLQVGATPPVGANALTVTLQETLASATNSPMTTGPLAVTEGAGSIPVNTSPPVISGTAQNGQTLTATSGSWTNSPVVVSYQWKSAGVNATGTGATTASYIANAADVGKTLAVANIATNASGPSAPATSAATSAVIDIIPTINTPASIPGTPQVGGAITAIDAIWNNSVTSRVYQWKVAGVNATGTGAATLTYTPAAGDQGQTLTITTTAINSGGTSAPSTSAPSAAVTASGGILDFSQPSNSALISAIAA